MATFEHRFLKCNFLGRGHTLQFTDPYVDGEKEKTFKTLPELLDAYGKEGFELVSHQVRPEQGFGTTGVTDHFFAFKRQTS